MLEIVALILVVVLGLPLLVFALIGTLHTFRRARIDRFEPGSQRGSASTSTSRRCCTRRASWSTGGS